MNVQELHNKIDGFLQKSGLTYEKRGDGNFGVRSGSTIVVVVPAQWNDKTIVKLVAPVAIECEKLDEEMGFYLAKENNTLLFGKFSLDVEGKSIWYEHALLGDFLDADELIVAVAAVVSTADQYDEKISNMARGKRLTDI